MPNKFDLISSTTVGAGGAASISFTSIPGTHTDLVLYLSGRSTGTSGNAQGFCYLSFNGSTSSFGSQRLLQDGSSSAADAGGRFAAYIPNSTATSNTFGTMVLYIPSYAVGINKSYSIDQGMENNSSANYLQGISAGLWSNTSAITSITIGGVLDSNGASANFAENSTATLYGISKS